MSLGWGPVAFVIVSDIIHVYFSYKTWIGNRRRKYRLMGIEVPPPRGGPADFSDQSEFVSKSALNPGEETATEVGDDNDRNDEVSICLSEGSSQGIWNAVTTVPIFSILCSVHALDSVVHIQKRLTESQVLHPAWAEGTVWSLSSTSVSLSFVGFVIQRLEKPLIYEPHFCQTDLK